MRDEVTEATITQQEARLREGFAHLADRLQTLIDQETRRILRQAVETRLENYRRAMDPEAYRKTFQALLRDRLLESFGISELSIL